MEEFLNQIADERIITSSFGHKLFCRYWRPKNAKVKALVFVSHGYAQHCEDGFDGIVGRLLEDGYFVFSHDHYAHGKSGGRMRSNWSLNEFYYLYEDVITHVKLIRKELHDARVDKSEEIKIFALSHSMGSLISILANQKHKAGTQRDLFNGIVAVGPLVAVNPKLASKSRQKLTRLICRIFPNAPAGKLDLTELSSDKEVVERVKRDKLCNQASTVRFSTAVSMLNGIQKMQNDYALISLPILIIHGEDDKISHSEASKHMFQQIASIDKKFHSIKAAKHRVHEEVQPHRDECVNEIVNWYFLRTE